MSIFTVNRILLLVYICKTAEQNKSIPKWEIEMFHYDIVIMFRHHQSALPSLVKKKKQHLVYNDTFPQSISVKYSFQHINTQPAWFLPRSCVLLLLGMDLYQALRRWHFHPYIIRHGVVFVTWRDISHITPHSLSPSWAHKDGLGSIAWKDLSVQGVWKCF